MILGLSLGGNELLWSDPAVLTILTISAALFLLFLLVEGKFAKEPIMPLYLLRHRTPLAASLVRSLISVTDIVKLVHFNGDLLSYLQSSHFLPSCAGSVCYGVWNSTHPQLNCRFVWISYMGNGHGQNGLTLIQWADDRVGIIGLQCWRMHCNSWVHVYSPLSTPPHQFGSISHSLSRRQWDLLEQSPHY